MLYVIGTPIGNRRDITLRALETLNKCEVVVCEDSRVTGKLFSYYRQEQLMSAQPRLFAMNEFNEEQKASEASEMIRQGMIVGLVSDAGMPALSDPGYRLISAVLKMGETIEIIPGPTALTTALPWSGLGGEVVLYLGFLPKKSGKARANLEAAHKLKAEVKSAKIVLYVSPHRLSKDLALIEEVMGNVNAVLLRELTKIHQERVEGTVGELIVKFDGKKPKGELVLVLQ